MSAEHGFTIEFIAVIRNGDSNFRMQQTGERFELKPGEHQRAVDNAVASAVRKLSEFVQPRGNVS